MNFQSWVCQFQIRNARLCFYCVLLLKLSCGNKMHFKQMHFKLTKNLKKEKKKQREKYKFTSKSSGTYLIKKVIARSSDLSIPVNGMNQLFFFVLIIAAEKWCSTGIVSHGFGISQATQIWSILKRNTFQRLDY